MTKILATVSKTTPRLKGIDMIRINGAFGHPKDYKKVLEKYKNKLSILDIPGDRKKHRHMSVKDEELIDGAIACGMDHIGISYVETMWDVDIVRAYCGTRKIKIIAKVETKKAVENLDSIIDAADGIMIDRQDLSTAVGFEKVPALQEIIVGRVNKAGKPIIIASEFLLSMMNSPKPSKADVSDIERGAAQGADYLMLSEETAIGKYPQEAIDTMRSIINTRNKRVQAVILAAGAASGLGGLTAERHQCLLDCGGQTILEHLFDSLTYCGILEQDIIVVAGKGLDKMRQALNDRMAQIVYNPWFDTTNMLVSLWLAKDKINSDLVIIYGDIVFDRQILKDLLKQPGDAVLAVERKKPDEDDEKICVKSGRMVLHPDYDSFPRPAHKSIPVDDAFGEFIGLARFTRKGLLRLFEEMDTIVRSRQMNAYLFQAFENMVKDGFPIDIVQTKGKPWNDNDTLDDFKRTRKVVFPAIKRRHSHK